MKVPSYENHIVGTSDFPSERFAAPQSRNFSAEQLQSTGEQISHAGGEAYHAAMEQVQQANNDRVDDAVNQAQQASIQLKTEALQLQGKNALDRPDGLSLPDEFAKKLNDQVNTISESLGNDDQRRAFAHAAGQINLNLQGTLTSHMLQQQKVYRAETQQSTIDTATQQGTLLWGDAGAVEQSTNAIKNTVDAMAQDQGWDAETKKANYIKAVTPMHAGIIQSMLTGGNVEMAKKYYEANSADMTLQARANIQPKLIESANNAVGEGAADEVWNALGPKTSNDPIKMFDMEQQIRQKLKDHPDAMKIGIDGLRQRAQAMNAQQTEEKAQNISGVWKQIDAGTPINQIRNSDAWLSLTDTERHQIRNQLESEAATRASRDASASARSLSDMQRQERLNLLQNGDKYLTASDPNVLSKMSRAQVEALRSNFGMEATQHLLDRWDGLQKPGKIAEAKFDTEDFNQVADQLGLSPYNPRKTEDNARALGSLKYRTEQLIDMQQQNLGRTLTRAEKMDLMRNEMSKTVVVNPGIFHLNKTVPVITLNSDQANHVVVPETDRSQIIDAMQRQYKRNPRKEFEPTESNIKAWYLKKQSNAAGLINGE